MRTPQSAISDSTVWAIVIAALLLRIAFVVGYAQFPPLQGDDGGYDRAGQALANGEGYQHRFVGPAGVVTHEPLLAFGPLYPTFLAGVYLLLGHSIIAVKLIHVFLGAAVVFFVFRIARAAFDDRTALLAAALAAFHPALIIYTGMLLTETLFALLITVAVWGAMTALQSQAGAVWARAGILLGLSALLRSEALAMIILAVGVVLWYGEPLRKARNLLILGMALAVTIGVWTVRNYLVFNELILVSSNGGQVWLSTTEWQEWPYNEEPFKSLVKGLNGIQRSHVLQAEGIKNILNDPLQYLRLCIRRLGAFWLGSHTTYLVGFSDSMQAYYARGALAPVLVKGTLLVFNLGLLGLALWGVWTSVVMQDDERYKRLLMLCPVVAVATVHFFLFATSRYQVPIIPLLMIFTAAGMVAAADRFRAANRNLVLG